MTLRVSPLPPYAQPDIAALRNIRSPPAHRHIHGAPIILAISSDTVDDEAVGAAGDQQGAAGERVNGCVPTYRTAREHRRWVTAALRLLNGDCHAAGPI